MLVRQESLRRLEAVRFVELLNRVQGGGKHCEILSLEVWLLVKVQLLLSSALSLATLLHSTQIFIKV